MSVGAVATAGSRTAIRFASRNTAARAADDDINRTAATTRIQDLSHTVITASRERDPASDAPVRHFL
jgi:hypothetical protein